MDEQTAIAELNKLTDADQELAHSKADNVLLDFLRSNGHAALADTFDAVRDRVGFWYA